MRIDRILLARLKMAEYNPRRSLKPNDREYVNLKRSLSEFGYVDPIIWNERTGNVVGGHQRLQVLRDMGVQEAEVSVVDLPEEKEKALNIALNKIQGEWDQPALRELLDELSRTLPDITLTGFDPAEVEQLFSQVPEPTEVHEDDFDVGAAAASITEPVTRLGDIWTLGQHRLLCGDATVASYYPGLMAGRQANMVFTDPPYNVDYEGGTAARLKIQNDKMDSGEFSEFLLRAFTNCIDATAPGGAVYVFHADAAGSDFRGALAQAGWLVKQCLIWVKNSLVIGRQDYQWKHEPILYGWKPGARHHWYGGRKQTTVLDEGSGISVSEHEGYSLLTISTGTESTVIKVPSYEVVYQGDGAETSIWRFDRPTRNGEHPTMKPVGLPGRAIKNSSRQGDIVLDPFGGSGSTLIAAEQLARPCYMMELDPVYCDVIVQRWEKFTGKKAERQ